MREDDLRESSNVEDRRGMSGVGKGGLGIGAIVVLTLIGWVTGINPAALIGGAEVVQQTMSPSQQQAQVQRGAPTDDTGKFVAKILGETEDVWSKQLPIETGKQYTPPILVLYSGQTQSGCGSAQSAMGPFYCPIDRKLYLDTAFFQDMQRKMGGGGDFAYAYVIAHEVGHHIQNLIGLLPKVQAAQQQADKATANNLSVRIELMADCLAGAWANHMNERHNNLTDADLQQAVNTASAIGDDRLMRSAGRAAVPDSFTHGSADQRVRWLATGFHGGTISGCNTFQDTNL